MAAPMSAGAGLSPPPGLAGNRGTDGSNLKIVYLQCYFVTIATILGTGVLGLPVTLSHSGLYPFLLSFLGGFVIQALLIYFFTDLLQRAYAVQMKQAKEDRGQEAVPLNDMADEDELEDLEEEHENNGPVLAGHVIIPKEMIVVQPPNLHLLGELFLCCVVRQLFDIVLIIQFVALLISYALAGSEAYAEVIGVDHFYVIPAFVWILTFAVVFALQIIQPIVSILTFAKGSLLLGTVVITFLVGASIHHEIQTDWTYVGAPFLMGTVALGGVVNVMPFLYSKIAPVRHQVSGFRNSILMGLTTCTVLNVLWCWAVLDIVPQRNTCFLYQATENNSFHVGSGNHQTVCAHNLSLESAAQNGEISTIPLTQIIHQLYPTYDWVALLVELFIMISITVSFLTIGAAMHHTLSGWVESIWSQDRYNTYTQKMEVSSRCQCFNTKCICRVLISLIAFAGVFIVAMLNPKGFEYMLERASSLFINVEVGFFIFLMIRAARNKENRKLKIALPLPHWAYHLQYIIPLYFLFAVGYDIFNTVYDWFHPEDIVFIDGPIGGTIFQGADSEYGFNSTVFPLLTNASGVLFSNGKHGIYPDL